MRTLWVGLVFAFGCSSNTVKPVLDASVSTCNLVNPRANSLQVPLVVEGEQTAIEIESPRLPCPGDILGVTVEVFDAQNLPVEVTTGFHDNAVTVQFKPTSAGLWFFHVNFLPSQGTVQFSMPVAAKRPRDAAVVETFPIDMTACTVLARTARGGVACELTDAMTTHFFRGGVEETSFPGRGLAVVGNVLWSVDGQGALERRRDTGTSLLLEGRLDTAFFPAFVGPESWHTETDAARAFDTRRSALLAHWNGTTLSELSRINGLGASQVLGIEGSHLVGIDTNNAVVQDLSDGANPLSSFAGRVVARDGFGAWANDSFRNLLVVAQPPWSNLKTLSVPLPSVALLEAAGDGADVHPVFDRQSRPVLVVVKNGEIQFEHWGLAASVVRVTQAHVMTIDANFPERVSFYAR